MALQSEIKIFTKNTLIVTLFFALALEISWDYIAPIVWFETNAGGNDLQFQQVEMRYMGNTATAISLALGQEKSSISLGDMSVLSSNISITEVLQNPTYGQRILIGTHMKGIQTYVSLLETNVANLLRETADRATTLDEYVALLKHYGTKTNDTLIILDEQILELKGIIESNATDTTASKTVLQTSLSSLDYTWVDNAIDSYTLAKNSDTRARIYLIYLERFRDSYIKLQNKNKQILTTLSENREAIISKSVIVIPSSGTDLLRELWLIQTEAERKAQKVLE